MKRRITYILFGFGNGVGVQSFLGPHHALNRWITLALSLTGASIGELVAELFVSGDGLQQAGLFLSSIGAFAMLLIYGIATY